MSLKSGTLSISGYPHETIKEIKEKYKIFNHTKDTVSSIFSAILKHCTA